MSGLLTIESYFLFKNSQRLIQHLPILILPPAHTQANYTHTLSSKLAACYFLLINKPTLSALFKEETETHTKNNIQLMRTTGANRTGVSVKNIFIKYSAATSIEVSQPTVHTHTH